MHIKRSFLTVGCIAVVMLLAACHHEATETVPLRAVKLETVGADTAAATSRYVATVRQHQHAELAFESGGRITDVLVDVGDRVSKGQVLARLDPEPARLKLEQAEANLRSVIAQTHERQIQLRQRQAMFDDGAISQATLTGVMTALKEAQAQQQVARSDRDLAARALRLTKLRAPFNGSVVTRLVQPQTEITSGQAVLGIEGYGHAQVVAQLPPAEVARFHPGEGIRASDGAGRTLILRLKAVSARMDGGAMQAIFDFVDPSIAVHSGDSLLLLLPMAGASALSVPLAGTLPTGHGDTAKLFVFQSATSTVREQEVRLGKIEGSRVQVLDGLAAGEQVVAAGAAFLVNGQKVLPYQSFSHLNEGGAR